MVPYTHTLCAAASEVSALLSLAGLELRPVLGVRDDAQALLSRRRAGAQLPRLLLDELLLLLDLGLGARLVVPLLVLGRGAEMAPLRHLGTRRVETALARQLLTGVTGVTGVVGVTVVLLCCALLPLRCAFFLDGATDRGVPTDLCRVLASSGVQTWPWCREFMEVATRSRKTCRQPAC